MDIINRDHIIDLITRRTYRTRRINKVGVRTIKELKNRKLQLKLFNDIHPSKVNTQYRKQMYHSIAYCWEPNLIIFNEEHKWNNMLLQETYVHEVNHHINNDIYYNEDITFAESEMMAHIAEYMYMHNTLNITKRVFKEIKQDLKDRHNEHMPDHDIDAVKLDRILVLHRFI